MTDDQQQKILASLYDRLFDAITYTPSGRSSAFRKDTTFIQMAKNVVLNPKDFDKMMSPVNPNGDMAELEMFSSFVDQIPNTSPAWAPKGGSISAEYTQVVNGANTNTKTDPAQQKIYDEASAYLNTTVTTTDFTGATVQTPQPSAVALAYDAAQAAYITAIGGFRAAYNGYDLTKQADQRAWNAVAPGLQLTVDQAWNNWTRAAKAQVEQAQNALASTINNAVSAVIAQSQKLVAPQFQLQSSTGAGTWLPTYAVPTNWPSIKGVHLNLSSANVNKTASASATSYGASAGAGWGLFSASAGVSGSSQDQKTHMDADNLSVSTELVFVTLQRPWLNPLFFAMQGWFTNLCAAHGLSDGKLATLKGIMPLIPVGFVAARNTVISANFSTQDTSFHSSAVSTHASAGWGPFSVSGSYSHSTSHSTFGSTMAGGQLKLEGLQVLAWINSITPAAPPLSHA